MRERKKEPAERKKKKRRKSRPEGCVGKGSHNGQEGFGTHARSETGKDESIALEKRTKKGQICRSSYGVRGSEEKELACGKD